MDCPDSGFLFTPEYALFKLAGLLKLHVEKLVLKLSCHWLPEQVSRTNQAPSVYVQFKRPRDLNWYIYYTKMERDSRDTISKTPLTRRSKL